MNRFLGVLFLTALSLPALAADPPKVKAPHQHHARVTWENHFANANLAHDGHLTLAEANGGDALVAKHFAEIDATHRGYVTEDDIRAWRDKHKVVHRHTKSPHARHRGTTKETPVAAASQTPPAVIPAAPPAAPVLTPGATANKD